MGANSAALVLPCRAMPSYAAHACPCRHRYPQPVLGIIPGSSPCGSCSFPSPATPGAPPLPAGRERCHGWLAAPQGYRGPPECRGPQTAAPAPARGTHPLLIHHDVVAPVLLGQVRGQDVKAPSELRKHHVVGVPCGQQERAGLQGQPGCPGDGRGQPCVPGLAGAHLLGDLMGTPRLAQGPHGARHRQGALTLPGRFSLAVFSSNFGRDLRRKWPDHTLRGAQGHACCLCKQTDPTPAPL